MAISVPRHVLPVIGLAAIGVSAFLIGTSQPDRATQATAQTPAAAPAGTGASVAGSGVVEPSSEMIEIGAQRPGLVTNVTVRPGDQVTRGQLLFAIDARDARSRVSEAEAAVRLAAERIDAARVDLTAADRQYRLVTGVSDPRAVAQQQVIDRRSARDQAAARLQVAQAELRQAQAQAASARTDVGLLEVRAPRTATVLQVNTREGQYATAGPGPGQEDPLMVLGETNPLHVRVDVDENEIERVAMGQPAVISPRGAANRRVRATFVRAEPLVRPKRSLTNSATERVDVRVLQLIYALPQNAASFFVGQQVDAFIPAAQVRRPAPRAQGAAQ